jgi:hypothetical protein
MTDVEYPLDMSSPVRHVATMLDRAFPEALSLHELTVSYKHPNPSDVERVKDRQGIETRLEARRWLVDRALAELGDQVVVDGLHVTLARGLRIDDLRWHDRPVAATSEGEAVRLHGGTTRAPARGGVGYNPPSPVPENWDALAKKFREVYDVKDDPMRNFLLGDILLEAFPANTEPGKDMRAEFASAAGVNEHQNTLRNWRMTAERWPPDTRKWKASWTTYQALQNSANRDSLMRNGLTTNEARALNLAPVPDAPSLRPLRNQDELNRLVADLMNQGLSQREAGDRLGLLDNSMQLAKAVGFWQGYHSRDEEIMEKDAEIDRLHYRFRSKINDWERWSAAR